MGMWSWALELVRDWTAPNCNDGAFLKSRRIAVVRVVGAVFWIVLGLLPQWSVAGTWEDAYIAGYAASTLEHEFGIRDASIQVQRGVLTVESEAIDQVDRTKVQEALGRIPGVSAVRIEEQPAERQTGQTGTRPRVEPGEAAGVKTEIYDAESKWLPHGLLFRPLHADPRWPRFAAAYRNFNSGLDLSNGFAGNFGESFSLYRNRAVFDGEWELGVQAGVFSLFDLDGRSIDLINADYRVGLLTSYRSGRFSGFLRLMHQSSHLGDEFLLNNPAVTRVNLSYEELDLKLSYEVAEWFRVYGGGGVLVRREPDIGRVTSQWGVELAGPRAYFGGVVRPVAYADFQANERTNWAVARSLMIGVQFENARLGDRRLQLLLEHFFGPSPDGQFFTRKVEWVGVGLHFFY